MLLSVIIPVYNCEKYLKFSVESVISQPNFSDIELILVDDGSTDKSAEICDSFAEKYKNIIVKHQKNSGVSVARNSGIKMSHSDRIMFLDADDYFLPNIFEKILAKNSDMVCFDFTKGDEGCISKFIGFDYAEKSDFKSTLYPAMALSDAFFNCWNKVYKKEIIDKYNIQFEPNLKYGEDMKFVYEYIKKINSFEFIREPLYFYNVNENSATQNAKNEYEIYKNLYLWLCEYFRSIDCNHEECQRMIESNFVYKSWTSISAVGKNDFLFTVKCLKKMLNDELFVSLYSKENYGNFQSRYDKLVDKFIKNKNAICLAMLSKRVCKIESNSQNKN